MRVRVLGCSGGSAPGRLPSCYLVDEGIAVDAGALAAALSIDEQRAVEHIFLTHAHWDHVRDLPLATINRAPETPPLQLHGLPETIDAIRTHLMNDQVWFSAMDLPSVESPYIAANPMDAGETRVCRGLELTSVAMAHTVPAVGYLVDDGVDTVMICADTGGGGALRSLPATRSPLRAVILETSFPNDSREFAELTGHLTPEMLNEETAHFDDDVLIFATHMKPGFEERLSDELLDLGRPNVRTLRDGEILSF